MIRHDITPTAQLGTRAPEAGRIRFGVKVPAQNGKKASMKSIDTLRFTSTDRQILEDIARTYGGNVQPWNDPSANPSHQFEVITNTTKVRVLLVPDGLSTWYELWSGGGCQRRCDGVTCSSPQRIGSDYELVETPCLCREAGERSCNPHTRLQVVLPEFAFTGVWRFESAKGWNAAEELPGMFALITACAMQGRMVDADFAIERCERMTPTGKKNFVKPRLTVRSSVLELAEGGGVLSIGAGSSSPPDFTIKQLEAGPDTVIADAEVLDDDLLEIEALLTKDAENFGLDPNAYIDAIRAATPGDRTRWRNCSTKVRAGVLEPLAIAGGRVQWKVNEA